MLTNKNQKTLNQAPGYKHNAPSLKNGGTKPASNYNAPDLKSGMPKSPYNHPAPQLKTGSTEKARTYKKNATTKTTTGGAFGKFIGQ